MLAAVAVLSFAGCSGHQSSGDGDSTKSSAAALDIPGLTPLPVDPATSAPIWDGTEVELEFADALASCSYQHTHVDVVVTGPDSTSFTLPVDLGLDSFLEHVRQRMTTSACINGTTNYGTNSPPEKGWLLQRNDPACNEDPSTHLHESVGLTQTLAPIAVPAEGPFANSPGSAGFAQAAIEQPVMNLCIAQHLRTASPGATGGAALLLSAADQRELLELTRERAQIAMLQFAQLGLVFATPQVSNPQNVTQMTVTGFNSLNFTTHIADLALNPAGDPAFFIPVLQEWAQTTSLDPATATARSNLTTALGNDFATSAELLVDVSQELARLLARSGSAHLPRGGAALDAAADTWGGGSWRQRTLASLFGGDPLVQEPDNSSPWTHFLGLTAPGTEGEAWASPFEDPFVDIAPKPPQVDQLLALARDFNAVVLEKGTTWTPETSSLQCHEVIVPDSASRLYRAVEAGLRTRDCSTFDSASNTCTTVAVGYIPDPSTTADGFSSFDLWKKYLITPDHATALVTWLAQTVGKDCQRLDPTTSTWINFDLKGASDLDGAISSTTVDTSVPAYVVDPSAIFKSPVLRERAGLYSRNAHFTLPRQIDPSADPTTQGFETLTSSTFGTLPPPGSAYEEMRVIGSVAALTAASDALRNAQSLSGAAIARVPLFLGHAADVEAIADAATGSGRLIIRPSTTTVPTTLPISVNGNVAGFAFTITATLPINEIRQTAAGSNLAWDVDLTASGSDSFFDASSAGQYTLLAIPNDPWAAVLAEYPSATTSSGRTIDQTASLPTTVTSGAPIGTAVPGNLQRFRFGISLPAAGSDWSLVVRRIQGGVASYRPAAAHVSLRGDPNSGIINDGQAMSFNGTLSDFGAAIMTPDALQPSMPAFDGFGLPAHWVPPTDPSLFGASAGTDVVSNYLSQAQTQAQQATDAVQQAFTTLLQEQTDQAQLAAATAQSQQIAKLNMAQLCGTSLTCDASSTSLPFDVGGIWDAAPQQVVQDVNPLGNVFSTQQARAPYGALNSTGCVAPAGESLSDFLASLQPSTRLDCVAIGLLTVIPQSFTVLTVVANHINDPAVPAFTEFTGGTLQTIAIQQWTTLRTLRDAVKSLIASTDAGISDVNLFEKLVQNAGKENSEMAKRCNNFAAMSSEACAFAGKMFCGSGAQTPSDLTWADEASYGGGRSQGTSFGGGLGLSIFGVGGSISQGSSSGTSSGGSAPSLGAEIRLCEQYQDQLDEASWRLTDAMINAFAAVTGRANELDDDSSQAALASASGQQALLQTILADARQRIDLNVLKETQVTSFGLYRDLHSYDLWRAQALLDSARVAAITARRAIEAHYAVDLSALAAPEAFVAAPATWADGVFEYDLDMPAAVGLSVGSAQTSGIYPNKVLDYVNNLSQFVQGFTVTRPAAVAHGDTDVVTLPGPLGIDSPGPVGPAVAQGGAALWSYECVTATSDTWRSLPTSGSPGDSCLPDAPAPSRARVTFVLDPWGRMFGDVADAPLQARFNMRWDRLAVNLVGTGVLDCTKAADPNGCYSQAFVPYQLTTSGAPWVTDFNENWDIVEFPAGQIEGGKALAAEQWLDPLSNAWTQPYVSQIARTEYLSRPFGGTYELIIDTPPEVQLQNIERVQVLAGSDYWVKQ
ncbi:MAG: hypothetical protein ACRELY_29930 [Polyangiaceae bacterium]